MLNDYLEFLKNQSFVYICEYEGFYGTLQREVEVHLEEVGFFFRDELEEFMEALEAFADVEEVVGGKAYNVDETTVYIINNTEAFEAEYH